MSKAVMMATIEAAMVRARSRRKMARLALATTISRRRVL
jgi:hypothetical protein